MADQDRECELGGDEAQLFASFHAELERELHTRIAARDPDLIPEACAFAWAQFVTWQPDHERNWRGWLVWTALREAWRLSRREREEWSERVPLGSPAVADVEVWVDGIAEREGVVDVLRLLSRLPQRARPVALLCGFGLSHAQIAELTGNSRQRVDRPLVRSSQVIRELLGEWSAAAPGASPRVRRLAELERDPSA